MASLENILGLTWRRKRLSDSPEGTTVAINTNQDSSWSPVGAINVPKDVLKEKNDKSPDDTSTGTAKLSRQLSVRNVKEAFGTIRNKIRMSTRRRKRLVNLQSPGTPLKTPSRRRSLRLSSKKTDTKLYSPFCIDTPGTVKKRRTPRRKENNAQKRFAFSSPDRFSRELDAVSQGLQALTKMGDGFEKVLQKRRKKTYTFV